MDETEHCDVPPGAERGEMEMHECVNLRDAKLAQEVLQDVVERALHTRACMVEGSCAVLDVRQDMCRRRRRRRVRCLLSPPRPAPRGETGG